MLIVHKDISHVPIMELENNPESVWVKVLAKKTSRYVARWYPQPGGSREDFPRRYFCCGSLMFLLSVFILWFIYYVSDIFCKF